MSRGRRLLLAGMALALPASMTVAFGGGTAFAGKAPTFTGAADGTVHCTGITWKISMNPPLTASTGPSSASVKGKLSSCSVTGSSHVGETIQQGKLTGTLAGTSGGCGALILGTNGAVNLSITWKGKVGTAKATFDPTTVTYSKTEIPSPSIGFQMGGTDGGTVTGSFAGSVVSTSQIITTTSPTALAQGCAGKGIKKLNFTAGSFAIP